MNHPHHDFQIASLKQNIDDTTRMKRVQQCAASGLFKHALPEHICGFGDSFQQLIDHHKQLGYSTHDPGLILACNAHLWGTVFPLYKFGSESQKDTWLLQLINGSMIGGHAITESHSGSDPSSMRAHAIKNEDGYLLNSDKSYITNAPVADLLIVYAMLDKQASAFIVNKHDAGLHVESTPIQTCRGASLGRVVLQNCQLDETRLLGKPGIGLQLIQQALELERAYIFAGISGVMQWQLECIIDYSRRRQSGDAHLGKRQAISHRIADMRLRLDTIQLWLQHCASLSDNQQRITLAAAQTKLYASEAFLQSSLDAVQILGAHGLKPESDLAELVSDAMGGRLFSGTSEIQKNIIAALSGTGDGFKGRS